MEGVVVDGRAVALLLEKLIHGDAEQVSTAAREMGVGGEKCCVHGVEQAQRRRKEQYIQNECGSRRSGPRRCSRVL